MKTFTNTIENFASEALTVTEMNFVRGGGMEEPIDITIPPTPPSRTKKLVF